MQALRGQARQVGVRVLLDTGASTALWPLRRRWRRQLPSWRLEQSGSWHSHRRLSITTLRPVTSKTLLLGALVSPNAAQRPAQAGVADLSGR